MADAINPLIVALEHYDELSREERQALEALPLRVQHYRKGFAFVSEGDRPTQSCLMVEGFAARVVTLRNGRRQITDLHVTGDFTDLHSFYLKRMDHSVVAFTDCKIALIPHDQIRRLMDAHPHLSRLLALTIAVDAAIDRAWISCLGARPDVDHLAHFMCEIVSAAAGQGPDDRVVVRFRGDAG